MRPRPRWPILLIGGVGLSLLVLAAWNGTLHPPPERPPPIFDQPYPPTPPRTPFELALQQARTLQLRAVQDVNEERAALEAESPRAVSSDDQEAWWRQLMAHDRSGYLRRARAAAQHAAALARTRDEKCHAALVLTRLECYAGHHREELRLARRLIAMQPGDESALQALRRAEVCNGLNPSSLDRPHTGEWDGRTPQGVSPAK
jgi:hypothetical protein